jgi:cell division septation protein DedD
VALALGVLLAASAGPAAQAAAQAPGADALDSVEAAADSGRADEAREALDRWMDDGFAGAPPEVRARARMLQARLAEDPAEARRAYALVAVEGGTEGARARLRLAQLHLAEGRHDRAVEELETLRADVPGSALAAEAWLWTGRVREASGERAAACEAYRRASDAVPADAGRLREAVAPAAEACRRGDGTPDWGGAVPADGRVAAGGAGGAEGSGAGPFTVQIGAFGARSSAEALRERAAEAGFDARLAERDPADGLIRVFVGAYATEAGAEEEARRIGDEGFRAIVVETEPPEDGS